MRAPEPDGAPHRGEPVPGHEPAGSMTSPRPPAAVELTGRRLLARNTLWSLLGQGIPMVAAAVAVPILLHALGAEAFGVLTLAWTVIGYFSLFDFGIGRALTRVVAEGLGGGDTADLPHVVGTALIMLLGLGVFGALVLGIATPWAVHRALQVPAGLEQDTRAAFYLLAISLPAVMVTAGLGGVLAAYQRFKALNLIRIPMSILSFVLPMAVLPFTHGLAAIVSTLVAVRFVGTFAQLMVCAAVMPELGTGFRWNSALASSLLKSGGWLAVSNLIMPLFVSVDRMLIGALTSVAAIAYYAPPQEIATKLWILPGTLVSVLFPAFAASARANPARLNLLFRRGLSQVYCALFPPTLMLIVVGGDVLGLWLGAAFRQNGETVLQLLAAGAFFTGLSFIPSALIQAVGQPRKVGVLLMVEMPLFLLGVWWGVRVAGTAGAAVAWSLRALVDLVALMVIAAPSIPDGRVVVRKVALPALGTLVALGGAFAIRSLGLPLRIAILAVVLVPFVIWAAGPGLAEERRALMAALDPRY